MPNLDCEYDEFLITDLAEHPVIAHSVSPLARERRCKPLAARAWVVAPVNIPVEPCHNDAANTRIEFAELFIGPVRVEKSPHLQILRCNFGGGQCLRILIELALCLVPGNQVQLVFDA